MPQFDGTFATETRNESEKFDSSCSAPLSKNTASVSALFAVFIRFECSSSFPVFHRILVKLLEFSNDPVILAVACHDLGEFVRLYPRGKP